MRRLVFVFVLVSAALVAFAAGSIEFFTATYDASSIRLDWKVASGAQPTSFEVYRRKDSENAYSHMADVVATGADTYSYSDDHVYKSTNTTQAAMSYRLVVHYAGGTQEAYLAAIDRSPTAVQRSWGSIKMMFR